MSWHFLERWIDKTNQHSTLIGKFWITFLVICRMVVVASVGDRVYSDDQSEFKCNTLQPGCTNVCFNRFSPISHLRFWSFQILFAAVPSVVFVVYAAHKTKMKKKGEKKNNTLLEENEQGIKARRTSRLKPNSIHTSQMNQTLSKMSDQQQLHRFSSSCGDDTKKLSHKYNVEPRYEERLRDKSPKIKSTLVKLSNINLDGSHYTLKSDASTRARKKRGSANYWDDFRYKRFCKSENGSKHNFQYQSDVTKDFCPLDRNCATAVKRNDNNNNNSDNATGFAWVEPRKYNNKRNQDADQCIDQRRPEVTKPIKANAEVSTVSGFAEKTFRDMSNNVGKGTVAEADMCQSHATGEQQDRFEKNSCQSKFEIPIAYLKNINKNPTAPYFPSLSRSQITLPQEAIYENLKENKSISFDPNKTRSFKQEISGIKSNEFIHPFSANFRWYMLQVLLRLLVEIGFTILQVYLFGFTVPEMYRCDTWPCPNIVDCFISRPKEKTIFLWFMLIYSCICVVFNLLEFVYVVYEYIKKQIRKKSRKFKISKEIIATPPCNEKPLDFSKEKAVLDKFGNRCDRRGFPIPEEMKLRNKTRQMRRNRTPVRSLWFLTSADREGKYVGDHDLADGSNCENVFQNDMDSPNKEMFAFMLDSEEEREEVELDMGRNDDSNMNDMYNEAGLGAAAATNYDPNTDI